MSEWQRHVDAALERNKIAQAEFQQYAEAAAERNRVAQAEFRKYANVTIARNDRAQAEFRRYSERPSYTSPATPSASQPPTASGRGFACDPVTLRRGGATYMSSYIPTMAVCPACYATHVDRSRLASYFALEELPPSTEHTCDMSAAAIQAAWLQACRSTDRGNPGGNGMAACIDQFAQDFERINGRIQYLTPEITRLKQEIQDARAQFLHRDLGSAPLLPAPTAMGLFSAGSIAQHAAMSRYANSSDVGEVVMQKQAEMVRLRTELRVLLGVPDT